MLKYILFTFISLFGLTLSAQRFTDIKAHLTGLGGSANRWIDFDQDGDSDIVVMGEFYFDKKPRIRTLFYKNNRNNTFTKVKTPVKNLYRGDFDWADYNLDGKPDLFIIGVDINGKKQSLLYENNKRNPNFLLIPTGITGFSDGSVMWGDYDGDGDPDLLLTGNTKKGPETKIFRNDRNNHFTDIFAKIPGVKFGTGKWADIDQDGDLDVIISGTESSGKIITSIYLNNNGHFEKIPFDLSNVTLSDIAFADYDLDGDQDFVICGETPTGHIVTRLFQNERNGIFSEKYPGFIGVRTGSVNWGDYDHDGDPDLLLTGESINGPVSIIYRNDRNGKFTNIHAGLIGLYMSDGHFGDYDLDGDLDVLISGISKGYGFYTKVYRNDYIVKNISDSTRKPAQNTNLDQGIFNYSVKIPPMPRKIYYYVFASCFCDLNGDGKKGYHAFFSPIKKQTVEYQLQRKFNQIIHKEYTSWPKINQGEIIENGFVKYSNAVKSKKIAIEAYKTNGFKIHELKW